LLPIFRRLLPIFRPKKWARFIKNQYYDPIFAQTGGNFRKKREYVSPMFFRRKCFINRNIFRSRLQEHPLWEKNL
jgi:hypothetical protein